MEELAPIVRNRHAGASCPCFNVAIAVLISAMVTGCGALTRVDEATHVREVENFKLTGLNYDEAVKRIKAAGFDCPYRSEDKTPRLWSFASSEPTLTMTCAKASFEIFCPQRRYVKFYYLPAERRVVFVERPPRFEEHSCF